MPNTILGIQIIPKVLNPDDHYTAVEAATAVVEASGVNYEVGAVGRTMEGERPVAGNRQAHSDRPRGAR